MQRRLVDAALHVLGLLPKDREWFLMLFLSVTTGSILAVAVGCLPQEHG